ncbi:hypothetical protein EVAR_2318_1 [Eumeta japonica]|uniref:Uncharacterized protein n=1 Tax=Eumeta variegata TaxID=151549 RepID=A0A4C1SIT7_EUMVA|nr:hypothetical protein EVAR_2318_1 [Eumeta japonica]
MALLSVCQTAGPIGMKNFYVYSNESLDDFKTQLDPVGGTAGGISLKAFPGRTTARWCGKRERTPAAVRVTSQKASSGASMFYRVIDGIHLQYVNLCYDLKATEYQPDEEHLERAPNTKGTQHAVAGLTPNTLSASTARPSRADDVDPHRWMKKMYTNIRKVNVLTGDASASGRIKAYKREAGGTNRGGAGGDVSFCPRRTGRHRSPARGRHRRAWPVDARNQLRAGRP